MKPTGASRMIESIMLGNCEAKDMVIPPPKEKPMIEKVWESPIQLKGEEVTANKICNDKSLESWDTDSGESE